MFMLGFNETIDQLSLASSVRWYGHVMRREDSHVLIRSLDLKIEAQMKKGRPKRTGKNRLRMKV